MLSANHTRRVAVRNAIRKITDFPGETTFKAAEHRDSSPCPYLKISGSIRPLLETSLSVVGRLLKDLPRPAQAAQAGSYRASDRNQCTAPVGIGITLLTVFT